MTCDTALPSGLIASGDRPDQGAASTVIMAGLAPARSRQEIGMSEHPLDGWSPPKIGWQPIWLAGVAAPVRLPPLTSGM